MTLKRTILLFLLFSSLKQTAIAQNGKGEADLKAVFIYNFTRYIEWDSTTTADKNNFVIGIIGFSPVNNALAEIARTNRVNNKRILLRYYYKPEDIQDCQVLFIPKGVSFSLSSVLARTEKGTLTVSEEPGFAKQGTALNFIIENDKVKFEANLKALFLAGLKASSQLLKLAKIVD